MLQLQRKQTLAWHVTDGVSLTCAGYRRHPPASRRRAMIAVRAAKRRRDSACRSRKPRPPRSGAASRPRPGRVRPNCTAEWHLHPIGATDEFRTPRAPAIVQIASRP